MYNVNAVQQDTGEVYTARTNQTYRQALDFILEFAGKFSINGGWILNLYAIPEEIDLA